MATVDQGKNDKEAQGQVGLGSNRQIPQAVRCFSA